MNADQGPIFLDVDTQRDFMEPSGNLYVPGAVDIVENLRRLVRTALRRGCPLIATVDVHAADDPEFADFPPHCVSGTEGARKIDATHVEGAARLELGAATVPARLLEAPALVVEKDAIDAFSNPAFRKVLDLFSAKECVVFGVATEHCVRCVVLGLLKLDMNVTVAEDAVKAVAPEKAAAALREMKEAGARFDTTAHISENLGG